LVRWLGICTPRSTAAVCAPNWAAACASLDRKFAQVEDKRGNAHDTEGEYNRAMNRIDQRIADCSRAIEINPQDFGHYDLRGNAYYLKHDYAQAIADYSRAVKLRPNYFPALCQLGITKFHAGDFKGAAGDLLRCRELRGDSNNTVLFRFLARARAGEADAAAELEANAGPLDVKEWPYAVVELYLGRRSPELTLGAASKSNDRCEAQFFTSEWYILQNKPAEAATSLCKAVETCPRSFWAYGAAQAELKRLIP
jgi:tetratricopeptide (TPR) repeat protein